MFAFMRRTVDGTEAEQDAEFKRRKKLIEKKYILEKIRKLNIEKQNQQQEMASNIPKFESTFVQLHKNYYNN